MNKTLIGLLVAGTAGFVTVGLVADDYRGWQEANEREEYEVHGGDDDDAHAEQRMGSGTAYLSDRQYLLYETECGGCHLAYPPSMLPHASWRAVMGNLEDHFGDNAELESATADRITAFLARRAAGKGRGEYGERSWKATLDRTPPLRITQTDYFLGQHHEIPEKVVAGNPDVRSFSRCESCHEGAGRGQFDEHAVRIPGYGRWDD